MEQERSTVPAELSLPDAISLLDAPSYDTPDSIETAHTPLAWLVVVVPIMLVVGAVYVIWQATKMLSLPLP